MVQAEQQQRAEILERFKCDVAQHEVKILMDNDCYRHIRCSRPESGNYSFSIATFPGHLVIAGDMGSWTFSRVQDMFKFFRGSSHELGINPSYWAEKLVAVNKQNGPRVFDEDAAREWLVKSIEEKIGPEDNDGGEDDKEDAIAEADGILEDCDSEDCFFLKIRDFSSGGITFEYEDFDGCDVMAWSGNYLWCLFAIVWAIGKYDEMKAAPEVGEADE